jgi:hypothetical protein
VAGELLGQAERILTGAWEDCSLFPDADCGPLKRPRAADYIAAVVRAVHDRFSVSCEAGGKRAATHSLLARLLLLGYDPETVDFSDPALPPGMSVEKVHAGIAVAMAKFAEHGWEADVCLIRPDETAGPTVERQLGSATYDCVVIGAGVRLPLRRLALFESVINAVHKAAPGAVIAFNTRPDDSADAAARGLAAGSRAV